MTRHLKSLGQEEVEALSGKLRIGVRRDVEVTDAEGSDRPLVSQAFCSALPVACSGLPSALWRSFASLVLDAAYEATMWAAVLNAQRGGSNAVLLTRLGGGAFGNEEDWIHAAMRRSLRMAAKCDLDVRIVSYGSPPHPMPQMVEEFH